MPKDYVVITPVRDEVRHVGKTVSAMQAQTVPPRHWLIVDDGSTDGTAERLDELTAEFPWITVLHRGDRGFRAAGSGVMQAFHAGCEALGDAPWDFIAKLDADLSFAPDYFERCLGRFGADSRLGIGGGTVCRRVDGRLVVDSVGDPPFHVRGAGKIYRRTCWNVIAPLIEAPGWDTFDEVRANFHGWATRSFAELQVEQHKPTGAAAGRWADAKKNGRADYMTGYHPAYVAAKCLRRLFRRPFGLHSAALLAGYVSGYTGRVAPAPHPDVIRWLRAQQLRRLTLRPSIYG